MLIIIQHIYDCLNTALKTRLQIGPTKNICNGNAVTKFIAAVCSHITGKSAVIPFCSIVPTILIKGTIIQAVKVCMHKIIKIVLSCSAARMLYNIKQYKITICIFATSALYDMTLNLIFGVELCTSLKIFNILFIYSSHSLGNSYIPRT